MSRSSEYMRDALSGMNQIEIANKYGISRQAVSIAMKREFGTAYQGIWKGRKLDRIKELHCLYEASVEAKCLQVYLCTPKEFEAAIGEPYSPFSIKNLIQRRYLDQRHNSSERGIEWSIPLPLWLATLDGYTEDKQYVVSRKDYTEGFTPGNITLKTLSQAASDNVKQWRKRKESK